MRFDTLSIVLSISLMSMLSSVRRTLLLNWSKVVTRLGFIIQQVSRHMKNVLYLVRRTGRNFVQFCFNLFHNLANKSAVLWGVVVHDNKTLSRFPFWPAAAKHKLKWSFMNCEKNRHSFFITVRLKSRLCHEQLLLASEAFVHQPDLLNLLRLFGVLHLVYAILLPLAMRSCSMDFDYKLKKLRPEKTRCHLSRSLNSKPSPPPDNVGNEQWLIHHDEQHWIGGRGMNW